MNKLRTLLILPLLFLFWARAALAVECFGNNAQVTLNGTITSGATSLVVSSTAGFPMACLATAGNTISIIVDSELITVTGPVTTTTFPSITRGEGGTAAVIHNNGTTVTEIETARAIAQLEADDLAAAKAAVNIVHTETISGATTEALQASTVTTEIMTFSAGATVTIPQAAVAGQVLNAVVCQNGTGGFTPLFQPASGLTITPVGLGQAPCVGSGTTCFPTFTTTASRCGDFSLIYASPTQAYLTGSASGP